MLVLVFIHLLDYPKTLNSWKFWKRKIDPVILKSLVVVKFSGINSVELDIDANQLQRQTECAIFLEEFMGSETLYLLPRCRHFFHPNCVDSWLESHPTYLYCKVDVIPQSGEPSTQATAAGAV
ncbi:hypothetical protein Droror1_Dr00023072 [Drosera rotundifolia]